MTTVHARHFETLKPVQITLEGESIQSVEPFAGSSEDAEHLPFVSPGFFDIQINGFGGVWFSSPDLTVDNVAAVTRALLQRGITRYFPTLITASFEALQHGFQTLRAACQADEVVADSVAGYHLEGPYISAEDGPRGAHPLQHVRAADFDEFSRLQEASGGRIRLVTLAAEAENAVPFIHQCRTAGVVVALGHTGATPEQIRAAVDAGAQLSTHFGNGAHGMLPRHPNYLWEQLADERLWASVIADGWHVPTAVLKCVRLCKSSERTILTCDVSGFAGCAPGTYAEGDVAVEVLSDGRLVVAGQRQFLAGSGATTGECVAHMAAACGISLAEAVQMATSNPARLFSEHLPAVSAGQPATFSVFHVGEDNTARGQGTASFIPRQTFLRGKCYRPED
ncbi:MAG: amidohydrolase family protein [Fuerstiella sp.]